MTRRSRSVAFLSATTVMAGAALSLALAPAAVADIPVPPLGSLTASPSSPEAGQLVRISGTGCFAFPSSAAPAAGAAASADPAAAPADASGTV
ncbi:hypothetical protein ACXR2U_22625, partial [Jatrophihabitans sp. YIM 134969]